MALTLTQVQIDEIRRLYQDGSGLNAQGNYSHIYKYIGDQLPSSDVQNWFRGAEQANAGNGAYSAMIRGYSKRQMELRGIAYSDALMQSASNKVADRAIRDILDTSRDQHNGFWTFPSIDEIAANDAIGVGEILFDPYLATGDTARSGLPGAGGFNAGWAGTVLFSPLDSSQTWRLTQGGGIGLNSLDDFKNILFAYDALAKGMIAAGFSSALNYVFNQKQFWTDAAIGYKTWWESNTGVVLAIATQTFSSLLPASAQALGNLIEQVGVNAVLDMLIGAQLGKPVFDSTTDANFGANVDAYFGALTPAQIQSLSAELMPTTAAAMVSKAQTDVNTRAALAALSSVAVQISPAVAADLDLYDPATGTGELTDLYLKDRAAMLSWKMKYDSGARDDDKAADDFFRVGNKPYSADWDIAAITGNWDFIDHSIHIGGSPLQLAIDGKGITVSDHQIAFGSTGADSLDGSGDTDHLYGMSGADTLTGNKGNDYLQGGTNDRDWRLVA